MKRSLALHSGDLFPEQYQRGAKIKYSGPWLLPAPFAPVVVGLGLFPSLFFRFLTCLIFFFLDINFLDIFRRQMEVGAVLSLQSSAVP